MTDTDDVTFGPFIRNLAYANTTKFANESGQRQLLVEMVERFPLEGMDPTESLAIAAAAEQNLLNEYYAD